MGRSKFPGKPTKYLNRTRVNVLPPSTTTVAPESTSVLTMTVDTNEDSKKSENNPLEEASKILKVELTREPKISNIARRRRKTLPSKRSPSKRNILIATTTKKALTPKLNVVTQVVRHTRSNVSARRSVRGFTSIRTVPKRRLSNPSLRDSNNLVGKFVLPSRSVHSSRVIKPNKRFINVESPDTRTLKRKVLPKKPIKELIKAKVKNPNSGESGSEQNIQDHVSDAESILQTPFSKGKPLLREARLQVGTKNTLSPDGPFSLTTNVGSTPGYVNCGVCGASRINRLVKQAKKFNIYSCEMCRKFISKMIKRQKCKAGILVCQTGLGSCPVSSINRNQNLTYTQRTRCSACWLKMCLRSFQLPLSLRHCLLQLLPKQMQSNESLFGGSSLPLKPWPANVENTILNVENTILNLENPMLNVDSSKTESTTVQIDSRKQDVKLEELKNSAEENKEIAVRQRPVRLKPVKKDERPINPPVTGDLKRQKIDLKGPRVKHVCRSASIVLGQPLATFPPEISKKLNPECDKIETKELDPQIDTNKIIPVPIELPEAKKVEMDNILFKQTDEIKLTSVTKLSAQRYDDMNASNAKRTQKTVSVEGKLPASKKTVNESTGILIDFWESYDPDEICKNGFCLIASEPLPMQAICFLCGSGGREPLLHCSLCCEPYHSFCLELVPLDLTNNNQRFNWLCPRCTTCSACGQMDRQKINCQKCHKDYHPECFNDKWRTNDRPSVCSTCLRCKSCGSSNITKFVGNLALCICCFKLRKKGNFCPLCQKCYDDNDYESKMMECNQCKKWVHAKCEGLTDEQYQILSLLPESVEYKCITCCNEPSSSWRQAIQMELKSCFNNVIRLLSKNRTARNLIKWSPAKPLLGLKTLGSAKRLQFADSDEALDNNDSPLISDFDRRLPKIRDPFDIANVDEPQPKLPLTPTMVEIKNKLNSAEHISLPEFNHEMIKALSNSENEELLSIYHSILSKVFPWYDPTQSEIPETSFCDNRVETTEPIKKEELIDFEYKYISNAPVNDSRMCILCKALGDGLSHQEARLLYCGNNEWIHANCALWSSEVYEEIDGSLQNVPSAVSRGRSMRCSKCKHKGASVGCCLKGCYETYHFRCAQQSRCHFLQDKNVYCSSHDLENKTNVLTSPSEFHINRSVYIELDKKKKKYSEPDKVHFMVGSLSVSNLGKIVPILSDNPEYILPAGFVCSRLFWSTIEPWKLIPYIISTSILNTNCNLNLIDRNFTIDHTKPKQVVEKKVKELGLWLKDLDKDRMDVDYDDDYEPQNAGDILPPELMVDDIFEVLPHDLLDGISVQDMLMSYEELLNMDFKSTEISDNIINGENMKKVEDEDCDSEQVKSGRELKRSKSEVFSQINELSKARSQQRSCSLTFSCKVDNSLSPVIKKRKINARENPPIYPLLLQVDGANDSSGSECGSPTHEMGMSWGSEVSEEPVTCEKCQCTYRTVASYKRHLGTCDALFTSESDSEEQNSQSLNNSIVATDGSGGMMDNHPILVKINEQEPQVIASYESYSTYQATQNEVHSTILNTQTFVTQEATNEVVTVPENQTLYYPSFQQQMVKQESITPLLSQSQHQNIAVNPVNQLQINPSGTITISTTATNVEEGAPSATVAQTIPINQTQPATFCVNQAPISIDQTSTNMPTLITVDGRQPVTLNANMNPSITINSSGQVSMAQPVEIHPQQVAIQQVPFSTELTPILNITPQNPITIDAKMLATPNIVNQVMAQTIVPQNQWVKPIVRPTIIAQKTIRPRARPIKNLAAKRVPTTATARLPNGTTVILPQSNNTPVIFQQLQSTNMVPTFMDSLQQQTGQNLQYVATITPQINHQAQLVQLQSTDNNYLSIVPGMQPTMIIQQPRVVADQLIVDSNGSMIWAATQPVQPVYYGFETIVQNTVMQSQQFLPTTVPGVLTTNSSYSATTQVFQTSKLEPVLDVSRGSIVVVNNCPGQIMNQQLQTVQVPQTVTHNITSTPVVASSPTIQNKPTVWKYMETPVVSNEINMTTVSTPQQVLSTIKPQPAKVHSSNSINLPVAPFVPEQGIPTNIVTPTPKPPTSAQSRPMSRVLPMQTNVTRENLKKFNSTNEKSSHQPEKNFVSEKTQKILILEDRTFKYDTDLVKPIPTEAVKQPVIEVMKVEMDPVKPIIDVVKPLPPAKSETHINTNKNYTISKKTLDAVKQKRDLKSTDYKTSIDEIVKNKIAAIKTPTNKIPSSNENSIKQVIDSMKAIFDPKFDDNHLKSVLDPIEPILDSIIPNNNLMDSSKEEKEPSKVDQSRTSHIDDGESLKTPVEILNFHDQLKSPCKSLESPIDDMNPIENSYSPVDNSTTPGEDTIENQNCLSETVSVTNKLNSCATSECSEGKLNHHKVSAVTHEKEAVTVSLESTESPVNQISRDNLVYIFNEELNNPVIAKDSLKVSQPEENKVKIPEKLDEPKPSTQSLKIVFQKENSDGVYKITKPDLSKSAASTQKLLLNAGKENGTIAKATSSSSKISNQNSLIDLKEPKDKVYGNKPNIIVEPKLVASETKAKKDKIEPSSSAAILYTVETQDGFKYSSTSLGELWTKVFDAVQTARLSHNMPPLPRDSLTSINNLQLLGLKTNGLKYLIEQLPGASKCTKYKPSFHIPAIQEDLDKDLEHTSGAARSGFYKCKRDEHVDMFGWLASKHRNLENSIIESELLPRRGSMTNLPMAMRFRQLKTTSKVSVGVYRSGIHGRGLFALRNFESGEMVIEYAGEVIRSILTDKREKYYNSKGIGCYMFRIDDNLVIDATMKGNAARFINHSCDPNCYSKVVEIHGHKHIIIFALRRIYCQEELTYDYKFPFEEDKIPCTCGARKCRKFLN